MGINLGYYDSLVNVFEGERHIFGTDVQGSIGGGKLIVVIGTVFKGELQ